MSESKVELNQYYEIHKDLATFNVMPFRYIQCDILGKPSEGSYSGFVSGTYEVIYGENYLPDLTPEQLIEKAFTTIQTIDAFPKFAYESLLDHGGNRLSQNTRLMITKIWPLLKHVLIIEGNDPITVWNLSKSDAIHLLKNPELKTLFNNFHQNVLSFTLMKEISTSRYISYPRE